VIESFDDEHLVGRSGVADPRGGIGGREDRLGGDLRAQQLGNDLETIDIFALQADTLDALDAATFFDASGLGA
jgi:hypothetical protein